MPYQDHRYILEDDSNTIKPKEKFEERYIRQTYFIHKDIVKYIAEQSRYWGKGDKTQHINKALQEYFRLDINLNSHEKAR